MIPAISFRFIFKAIFLLLFLPCVGLSQSTPTPIIQKKLDQLFPELPNQPGCAVGVIKNGKAIYKKGTGLANLDYDIPITEQSVFEIGDLSMHFTGACILILAHQRKLELDAPIQKYLTDFPKYAKGQPTIRQCLHHSSGLRDYMEMIRMTGKNEQIAFTSDDAIALIKKQKALTIVPGDAYRYSYSGYLVLAEIVERISEQSLAAFAKANIFDPLDMQATFFLDDKGKVIKNRALSYQKKGESYLLNQSFNFTVPGAKQLYTTIEDFLKWMANFRQSKIGGTDFIQQLHQRGITNHGDTMSYATGMEHGDFKGYPLIGHNGYWEGSTAMFLQFPTEDLYVIAFSNNGEINAPRKAFQTVNQILENKPAKTDKPEVKNTAISSPDLKLATSTLQKFCGPYFNEAIGYNRKVYLENDTLWYADFETPDTWLQPIGANKFKRMEVAQNNTIEFKTEIGQPILYFQNGGRPPIRFYKFEPVNYTASELTEFTGAYQSNELEVTYIVKVENKELVLYLADKEIVRFSPLMSDLFNSAHDGFLKFYRAKDGQLHQFTLTDYWLGEVVFSKIIIPTD